MTRQLKFPDGFLWGASTSSHQVEGGNRNNWSVWEVGNAKRLAEGARSGADVWKEWETRNGNLFPEMFKAENYVSGLAADHYNRYEQDFDMARSLGHSAHRFSIEWSRIEPVRGQFDEAAIEHYRKVVAALRARGMEPFVTLWHWTVPLWFEERGGWKHPDAGRDFANYAGMMAERLGDVTFWITLNEPEVFATHAYLKGVWPPQEKSYFTYRRIIRALVDAHIRAYRAIKRRNADSIVCLAKHNVYFEAHRGHVVNRFLKSSIDRWWNFWFLDQIAGYQDALALNNYHHNRINYGFNKNENAKRSDMGWELYPESLSLAVRELKKYNLPVYVTEHGLADMEDSRRGWYITESLKSLHGAIADGVDVRGYLHWSLLDNFEWDKGFWPRFGLINVDFRTQERTIRPSAQVYKKICETNTLEY